MTVKRYYPAFYDDSYERTEHEVRSKEELLALPFVRDWASDAGFTGWWLGSEGHLMAVFDAGRAWYVVATLHPSKDECLEGWFDRPPWEGKP